MNLSSSLRGGTALGLLIALGVAAGHAKAQTAEAKGPEALGEIVVTAERRDTTLQRTPVAVTAITPDTLAKSNVVSLVDLNGMVPSLNVARNNGLQRVLTIRGLGYETAQNVSSQPGVGFFIDGVYIANNIGAGLNLVDLERVEVLRGPQSTLYGQSSIGGVVNSVTRQPMVGDYTGDLDFSYGTYNLVRANASVNVPLGQTFAVRVAGQVYRHDGFAKVPELGNYGLDNADDDTAKVSLMWKPNDKLSAVLTYQHYRERTNGAAQKNILDPAADPRILNQDYAGSTDLAFKLTSLTVNYALPFADVKFIGAYQDMASKQRADNDRLDFARLGAYDVYQPSNINTYAGTEEVTIASRKGGPVDWIAGIFFMQQSATQFTVEFGGKTPVPAAFPNLTQMRPATLPTNLSYESYATLRRYSYAPFGQATLHATDRLRVTVGLRYSNDRIKNNSAANYAAVPSRYSHQDEVVTGKGQIEYDIAPTVLGYVTYSKGYKPGGVNINSTPILVKGTFEAERLNAYEAGIKSRFLDNRLQVNLAGFYYDYKNFQYQEEDPGPYQGGVANIPKAKTYGAELETTYLINDDLRFVGNLTALDGKFEGDYFALDALAANRVNAALALAGISPFSPAGKAARGAAVQNTNGNTPPKLSKWSGSAALEHTYGLPWGDTLTSRAEVVFRSSFQYRIFNTSGLDTVPGYALVNLHFAYKPQGKPFELDLAVSNLLDQAGMNAKFSDPFGVGASSKTYVPPRQVYGTIRYHF